MSVIGNNINNTPVYGASKKNIAFFGSNISEIVAKGDKALNENKLDEALESYLQANQQAPDNNELYKKLGKVYFNLKNYTEAEKNVQKYLQNSSDDIDSWIELGETQRLNGYYFKALSSFEKAYELDKANDLAKRSIMETKNDILALHSPDRARKERQEYAVKNLKMALDMTINYMTPEYMKDIEDVTIEFGETAKMSGTANIAQYENAKKGITVSNSYIYAAPQVIAAYLTHESVHAKDKDAYTSIKEEQDAYETAAKFWMKNSNGIKDPEMDYAVQLYKQSPSKLSNRVEEIYTLRDPNIAKTSPNHPPHRLFNFNLPKSKAASQSIRQYDVIA